MRDATPFVGNAKPGKTGGVKRMNVRGHITRNTGVSEDVAHNIRRQATGKLDGKLKIR